MLFESCNYGNVRGRRFRRTTVDGDAFSGSFLIFEESISSSKSSSSTASDPFGTEELASSLSAVLIFTKKEHMLRKLEFACSSPRVSQIK